MNFKMNTFCIVIASVLVYLAAAKQLRTLVSDESDIEFRGERVTNFFLSSKRMAYSEASVFCTEYGGKLLSIETEDKDLQAESSLARHGLASTPVWTSGMYEKASDAWVWSSSSSAIFSYTNWIKGPSQRKPNSTQCVYIIRESNNGRSLYGWNYNPCQEEYRFICEL